MGARMTSFFYYLRCWYSATRDHSRLRMDYHTAAITYFTLISSIPLLIVMTTIVSFFPIDNVRLETIILAIFPKLPFDPGHILALLSQQRETYGFLGIAVAYYFSMYLISGLKRALHVVMEVEKKYKRKLIHEMVWVSLLTLLTMAAYMLGALASATLATLAHMAPFAKGLPYYLLFLFSKVVNIYNLITIFSVILVIYQFLTPRPQKKWINTLLVSIHVTILLILLKKGFKFYILGAAAVNELYATFAGVFGFLIWIFISFNVMFIGARVMYYLEHGRLVSTPSPD
jgi:membrane protein